MRFFFFILSIVYISSIFILGGSPVVQHLSLFNPYSLLHIPLYGILTALLVISFMPLKINPTNPIKLRTRFLLPGGIASIVAMADEIHQTSIPGRDGS